ncbi:uncharacterized protein EI90DRAFT_3124965 [Cantharellus anzutake]|uniref:uncharacterized protein n=1 Tax=Cantharellus anzutake TaxID=1750568 RepID=UPI0019052C7A|nr:uncharacterized protein EI90DRAFT_3124965 [Cantharellus anzutake]KAF8329730.1 hypothetical protein EI90DRAFT_3124965 [Cantharellus anzutake]
MASGYRSPWYEIAPYSKVWGLAADVVSSSLLGASIICCSIVLIGILNLENKNKLRGRMLVGLFSSHVWAGVIFFCFLVASLSGHPPRTGTAACQASAYLVESAIWGQYLFTIAVAVVSYCILLHPLSSFTLALEKYWFLVDIGVCVTALGVAGLHVGLYSAVYIGGFCWSGSQRNVFNELINCLPRVIVFLVIVALYWRIHLYLCHDRFPLNTDPSRWRHPSAVGNQAHCPPAQHHSTHSASEGDTQALQMAPYLENLERQAAQSGRPLHLSGLAESLMLDAEHQSLLQLELDMLEQGTSNQTSGSSPDGASGTRVQPKIAHSSSHSTLGSTSAGYGKLKGSDVKADGLETIRISEANDRESVTDNLSESFAAHDSSSSSRNSNRYLNPYDAGPECSQQYTARSQQSLPTNSQGNGPHQRYDTVHKLMTHRAALLFLLFPLTYFILTVVSLTRLIVDYASSSPVVPVRALSRWALFLQGPLDALTYGLIAFKVKKEVGKEIKARYRKFYGAGKRTST